MNMGLLTKTNPAATRDSVIRHALIFGVIAAVIAPFVIAGNPAMKESWPILYPLAVLAGAALGGLLEWQPLDDVDVDEVVRDAEEEFDVSIPVEELPSIESVGNLFDVVLASLRSQHPERFTSDGKYPDAVWDRLKELISCQLGVDADEVVPNARFNYELR